MTIIEEQIEDAIANALAGHASASEIVDPLTDALARIIVGVHTRTGAPLMELLDLVTHQLDERVASYDPHNSNSDRRTDPPARP